MPPKGYSRAPVIERLRSRPGSQGELADRFEEQTGRPATGKAFRTYAAQQRGQSPDEAPRTRGPRMPAKGLRPPRLQGKGLGKAIRRFANTSPRRVLLAEMLLVIVITTLGRVTAGEAPRPSDFLAPFVVYLVLGFAAEVGGGTARLAAGVGGLVLLAVLLANAAVIVGALDVVSFGPGQGPIDYSKPYRDPQGNLIDPRTGGIFGGTYGP